MQRDLKQLLGQRNTAEVKAEKFKIKMELEKERDKEEAMCHQKSRIQWLSDGDRNTRFFHSQVSRQAKKNEILGLRDENGIWRDDIDGMGQIVNQYFSTIFASRSPQPAEIDTLLQTMGVRVEVSINRELCRVFTPDEVKPALFDKYPLKSPGPDGRLVLFYQRF